MDTVKTIGVDVGAICLMRLIFSGVYRKRIAAKLPNPLFHRLLNTRRLSAEKIRKLHENLFYTLWHCISTFVLGTFLWSESWILEMIRTMDTRIVFHEWPHFLTNAVREIYLFELSFWISCLGFMSVETVRKDVTELCLHHLATITLVSLSYTYNYHRIGLVIMLLHDLADVLLYSAKVFNYLNKVIITNALFVAFVLVFFVTRLVIFPNIIRTAWGPVTGYIPQVSAGMPGCYILPILLSVLQILHVMWFVLILRMLHRLVFVKKLVERDIRSDDEGWQEHAKDGFVLKKAD